MRHPTHPGSFWLDRDGTPPRPPLLGDLETDVAIVGGGIAGVCVARALLAAGKRVAVVEADRVGRGTTGRNAGFVLAEGSATSAEIARTRGPAAARALRDAGLATRAVVSAIVREAREASGADVGLSWTGSLRLATSADEWRDFAETAEHVEGFSLIAADVMPAAYRGLGFLGGLVEPQDGVVHPLRLLRAAIESVERLGGAVFERSPVEAIEPCDVRDALDAHTAPESQGARGHHVRVRCARGSLTASDVVVTTNAWLARLLPELPVVPMRAQMLAARVDPAPDWAMPVYASRGTDYWRALRDGTVLVGGRRAVGGAAEETDDARPGDRVQDALDRLLRRLVGPAATIDVTDRWAGTMGFTPDAIPIAGRVPGRDHVFVLGGFHGHGMGWGPGLAERVVDAVLGRSEVPEPFAPTRSSLRIPSIASIAISRPPTARG